MQVSPYYINFVLNSLMGQGPHIDRYFATHRKAIEATAKAVRKAYPIRPQPLYRGVLLNPADHSTTLEPKPEHAGISFSEDRNIAAEFADIHSDLSQALMAVSPELRGFLIEHTPKPEDILFHYKWIFRLDLIKYIKLGPMNIGELQRQKEIILIQRMHKFNLMPIVVFET